MRCNYHPAAELIPEGTGLRCPVVINETTHQRCPTVAFEYDAEMVDIRHCSRCGKRLYDDALGQSAICNDCRHQAKPKGAWFDTKTRRKIIVDNVLSEL